MLLKKFILIFIPLLAATQVYSQDSARLIWEVTSKRIADGVYELNFSTQGSNGWQLYDPNIRFGDVPSSELSLADSSIQAELPFRLDGKTKRIISAIFDKQEFDVFENGTTFTARIKINGTVPASLLGTLRYTFGKSDEFYPLEPFPFTVGLEGGVVANNRIKIESLDISKPLNNCGLAVQDQKTGLWKIFLLGFLGGLVALLTPCVFPMVPLTVSFFTKKSGEASRGTGSAALYGFFIFMIYIAFSIPFHIIGKVSPTIYNDISTNIYLNIIFFIIFIVFAISFFGYFEITLPSSFANSANAKQGSNILGIFFMALTLAIVSFSCTGPILGTLLVGTASEGAWPLTVGLAGFGLALGLPFALFAMFPQWLHSLPKSGGWLNTVKVVLGFIELALALKFLSNADLVTHWGLLKREIFFAIWVLIGLGLFFYLVGWIKFPHDDARAKISIGRKLTAFVVLLFTLYLAPGISNSKWANIGLVSGFPPPHCYSMYSHPVNCEEPLKDYDEALKLAKEKNRPIMIDFTGWACVNCRKMEENVWPKAQVKEMMEKFILVSLYVDDKVRLPANSQFIYRDKDSSEKKIITVGDKWSTFQTENFNASSQPWYILLSPDETLLAPPVGYTPNASEFTAWLRCGYDGFEKKLNAKR